MSAPGHVSIPFTPRAHQRAAHAQLALVRFLVLVWHRRAGKTVFAIVELILAALRCQLERGRFGYVAPLLKQAKSVAWDYLKAFTRPIPGCSYNESELEVTFPNGTRTRLFGADNPDAMRGVYFDGVVVDEVADMKPSVWGEILRPALADRKGWAIFIGTPKGVNLFSELYFLALKGEDGWAADLKRASDTDAIPPEEIAQARKSMSAPQFAQEFDCDFAAAVENTLLPLDTVLASQALTLAQAEFIDSPRILGVDVARFGDDRTVLYPRQGKMAFRPRVMRQQSLMETAGQVARSIEKWAPDAVFIDQTGMGGGVVDRLRELGHEVLGVDFGSRSLSASPRMKNRRAEMWWAMAEWVKAGGALPRVQELTAELTAVTYTYDSTGAVVLESKADLKARGLPSPDLADALALTFAAPVARKPLALPGQRVSNRVRTDFDPYEERLG